MGVSVTVGDSVGVGVSVGDGSSVGAGDHVGEGVLSVGAGGVGVAVCVLFLRAGVLVNCLSRVGVSTTVRVGVTVGRSMIVMVGRGLGFTVTDFVVGVRSTGGWDV